MATLFVSHSSQDRALAEGLAARLRERGFESFFLDFDPEKGIPVGRQWEKILYQRLLRCGAVIFLCSEAAVASKWCFAELAQARALGKPILPLRVAACALPDILREVQAIDLPAGNAIPADMLWRELARIGVSEDAGFTWDEGRAPYPGMSAFGESDAAVFFGRRLEIGQLVDLLGRMRLADTRLALVSGGSGCGKSSLVRAGLMPRLRRNRSEWIVLDATIAGPGLLDALAESLVAAHPQESGRPAFDAVLGEIAKAAAGKGSLARSAFSSRLRGLRLASEATRSAQVLWVVDQAERLLAEDDECVEARRFVARCAQTPGLPLQIVCTLRSDHLDALRGAAPLEGSEVEIHSLGALPTSRFAEVIEGPARLCGLELAPGLAAAMAADASRPDGLPLLAFALRELWDRYGRGSQKLTVENYVEDLGRLEGCVARRARETVAGLRLSETQQALLRETMSHMARMGESGAWVSRPIPLASAPEAIRPALASLVDARLLVTRQDGRMIEAAHDVLFRAWNELREWLAGRRKFMQWRRDLEPQIEAWESHGRDVEQVQLGGAMLAEAKGWLASHADAFDEPARRFVEMSMERAVREEDRWRTAYQTSLARQLAAQAYAFVGLEAAEFLERGLLLAAESMLRCVDFGVPPLEAEQALRKLLAIAARPVIAFRAQKEIGLAALAVDPRRATILIGQEDGQILRLQPGAQAPEAGPSFAGGVEVIEFSPDGVWFAAGDAAGACSLFNVESGEAANLDSAGGGLPVRAICFSADSRFLAVAFHTRVAVWAVPVAADPVVLDHDGRDPVVSMSFSGDATVLVTQQTMDDTVCWRWSAQQSLMRQPTLGSHVAHSPDGRFLAVSSASTFRALLYDTFGGEWEELANNGARMAFSADGSLLGMASPEHFVRIWRLPELSAVHTLRHNAEVWLLAFSPDVSRVVSGTRNNVAHVWDTATGAEIARIVLREPLRSVRFLGDDRHVLTLSGPHDVRLWDTQELREIRLLRHQVAALGVCFAGQTRLLATNARVSQFDREATLIDIVNQQPVQTLTLPDGSTGDGAIYAKEILAAHADRTRGEVRSRDGTLVARIQGAQVAIARAGAPEESLCVLRHERAVKGAVFSSDARHLATVSDHDTARVWEVATGIEVSRLAHDRPNVTDVDWSPDDRYLATASWDGTARVWLWRPEDLVAAAAARVGRNLNREEWDAYLPGEPYRETFAGKVAPGTGETGP